MFDDLYDKRYSTKLCCQCNIVQLILLADYRIFLKYVTSIHKMYMWSSNLNLK